MKLFTLDVRHKIIIASVCAVFLIAIVILVCVIAFSGSDTDTQQAATTEQTTLQTQPEETTVSTTASTEETLPEETLPEVTLPEETLPPQQPADKQDPQKSPSVNKQEESGAKAEITEDVIEDLRETHKITFGIDVSRYQGTIDWAKVAAEGVDYVMVRVGYRTLNSGQITADTNAKYNMQQAHKYGIKLGVYFFSTAISAEEAVEEANWVADFIAPYPITYPVAYNCEGYRDPENRQYGLTVAQRTDIALAFLQTIQGRGYSSMFYASKNELQFNAQWETSRIDPLYKIWVAQYPSVPYPQTERSSYNGKHAMWQYTDNGQVAGISTRVDVNIAYFGYVSAGEAQNQQPPEEALPDPEALVTFTPVNEQVTAKIETNLRNHPGMGAESTVLYTLKNGEIATRIGISTSGWSKLEFNGNIYYAVSSYLTTELVKETEPTQPPAETEPSDEPQIQTRFNPVDEQVTAKDSVNLRSLPSTTHPDSTVLAQLKKGDVARRTGVSDNGWSRLEYNGSVCYAVSSYLTTDLDGSGEEADSTQITTRFTEVNEQVTAKDTVNLRSMPSTTNENSVVVAQLRNGEIVTRTGINTDVGWSRVVYQGQVLYCVSSYLQPAEEPAEEATEAPAEEAPA